MSIFRRKKKSRVLCAIVGFSLGYALGKSGITDDNVNHLLETFFESKDEEKK